jgi:hypothetical protein
MPTTWTYPPTAGLKYRRWSHVWPYVRATLQRAIGAGLGPRWPRSSWVYDSGKITAITATSVTVAEPDGTTAKTWETSPLRWVSYDNSTHGGWEASNYDLIIDSACPLDPRTVIHTEITDHTADTLTINDISQRVTERVCPSLASLVGRRVYIIKRGGVWWSERVIDWPNDLVYVDGRAEAAASGTLTAKRALPSWLNPVGMDVLFLNGSDVLQRGRITSRTGRTIVYTGTTGTAKLLSEGDPAQGWFVIVEANAFYQRGRRPGSLLNWHGGLKEAYYTHLPDDTLATVGKPQTSVDFKLGTDPAFCPVFPEALNIFDVDFWIDQDQICDSDNDFTFNPDMFKTLRGLWLQNFDSALRYVNRNASFTKAIPTFSYATWLKAANINHSTGTAGTHTADGLPVSLTFDYYPIDIWYSIQDGDGRLVPVIPVSSPVYNLQGVYDGTKILGSSFDATHDGKTIVASAGPTRYVPRHIARLFDVSGFIPDVGDGGGAVWPPTEDYPGHYETRAASTHYQTTSSAGHIGESSLAIDLPANGDLMRYMGDNWDDPTTTDSVEGGQDPQTQYRDRLFVGRRGKVANARIRASMSGTATEGTTRQLTDTEQGWWSCDFWTPAAVFERTGTSTSATTTSLTDTGQSGSAFWNATFRSQVGLVITITHAGADHKRLITTHTGTTVGWSEPITGLSGAKAYEFRETDGQRNRWKGRTLSLRKPDPANPGTVLTATVTIDGNDDETLFVPAVAFTIDDTTDYRIRDPRTGTVWRRVSGAWAIPTGVDPRSPGPKFRKDQRANLQTLVKRYGLPMLRDKLLLPNWEELYRAINALKKSLVSPPSWTADPEQDGSSEDNSKLSSYLSESVHSMDDLEDIISDGWSTNPAGPGSLPPFVDYHTRLFIGDDATEGTADDVAMGVAARSYGYAVASVSQGDCPLARDVSFYVYGTIDSSDHDDGLTQYSGDVPELEKIVYHFNANGDSIAYRTYTVFSTVLGTTTTTVVSSALGSLNFPAQPGAPSGETNVVGLSAYQGYYAYDVQAIADWAFTDTDSPETFLPLIEAEYLALSEPAYLAMVETDATYLTTGEADYLALTEPSYLNLPE